MKLETYEKAQNLIGEMTKIQDFITRAKHEGNTIWLSGESLKHQGFSNEEHDKVKQFALSIAQTKLGTLLQEFSELQDATESSNDIAQQIEQKVL